MNSSRNSEGLYGQHKMSSHRRLQSSMSYDPSVSRNADGDRNKLYSTPPNSARWVSSTRPSVNLSLYFSVCVRIDDSNNDHIYYMYVSMYLCWGWSGWRRFSQYLQYKIDNTSLVRSFLLSYHWWIRVLFYRAYQDPSRSRRSSGGQSRYHTPHTNGHTPNKYSSINRSLSRYVVFITTVCM